jgi:hypothetical protein
MWQVDNDRYTLWRLDHELGRKRIDRLLDSVTVTDRIESPTLVLPPASLFRRFFQRLYSWVAVAPIVQRAPE